MRLSLALATDDQEILDFVTTLLNHFHSLHIARAELGRGLTLSIVPLLLQMEQLRAYKNDHNMLDYIYFMYETVPTTRFLILEIYPKPTVPHSPTYNLL